MPSVVGSRKCGRNTAFWCLFFLRRCCLGALANLERANDSITRSAFCKRGLTQLSVLIARFDMGKSERTDRIP